MTHSQPALYAGSFDPITLGHVDIVNRMACFYNPFVVLVANSPWKKYLLSQDERVLLIKDCFKNNPGVQVDSCEGLIVNYAKKNNIQIFIRGIRAVSDFEYELDMSNSNKELFPQSETLIAFTRPQYTHCSSKIVKEVLWSGGDISHMVPRNVHQFISKKKSEEI